MPEYTPSDIEREAILQVHEEVANWQDATCFVTEDVSFQMREVIKKARKNYYSIFEEQKDSTTGREKVFVPLTEWTVESVIKNTDLDTKDINVRAKAPKFIGSANLIRHFLRDRLTGLNFGEILDDIIRNMCIDGTCVAKIWEDKKAKKYHTKIKSVDLLNFYIDPVSESIQESSAVIERCLLTIDELDSYEGQWMNIEFVNRRDTTVEPYTDVARGYDAGIPMVELFERWGKISKRWITGKEADRDKWIDGVIIISGLLSDAPVVHKIIENPDPDGKKPYEECWLKKAPGRWYGRGIAEQLFGMQEQVNEVVNVRRNAGRILERGLFEIRKGSGIRQQALSKLKEGGGVLVNKIGEDIREMQTRNFAFDQSIADEQNMYQLSQKVTNTYEIVTGENTPASMPATNAVLQSQSARSAFVLIQEELGMFLQRVIEDHFLPIMRKYITQDEILRITGDIGELEKFDESAVSQGATQALLDYMQENMKFPSPEEFENAKEKATKKLEKLGTDRYVKLGKEVFDADYDVEVYVTNEEFDKNTLVQNLMQVLANFRNFDPTMDVTPVLKELFDILGLNSMVLKKEEVPGAAGVVQPQPQGGVPRSAVPPRAPGAPRQSVPQRVAAETVGAVGRA